MNGFRKQRVTMAYTEIIFYKDGDEIGRDRLNDDYSYDAEDTEPMTKQEIEDWS